MSEEEAGRRSTHVDIQASYAAIGASQADDLLKYPPAGSTPFEFESLLGSGSERFLLSSALLMTWGAQKGVGFEVAVLETENDSHYKGTIVSDAGQPTFNTSGEQNFAPDGTPYLQVGSVVKLTNNDALTREVRVLTVIDEEKRTGFVIGTTKPQEVTGEEFFRVELRADDSVWAVVRGFYHTSETGAFALKPKKRLKNMVSLVHSQIDALTPAAVASKNRSTDADE